MCIRDRYKPIKNIKNKDYLQVLAYMYRFDAKKGYYFYPDINHQESFQLKLNSGSTYENNVMGRNDISIIKLGLEIPQGCNDYYDFVDEIQLNEERFINNLKAIL